jgi:hypothetical protein
VLDFVYISNDAVLDGTDHFLGYNTKLSELPANATYTQNATFTLPQCINDNYYIFVTTNQYQQLQETNTTNNYSVGAATTFVQLTPPPDLQGYAVVPPNLSSRLGYRFDLYC